MHTYSITYSVGSSKNDERRYVIRGIPADRLGARILSMQSKGKVIYSIERETSL